MKKTLLLLCLMGSYQAAQAQVKFSPGIRAGLNSSNITSLESKSKTDFYVGATGTIQFTKRYSLQPEFNYSRQGANKVEIFEYDYRDQAKYYDVIPLDLHYLGFAIMNKFTYQNFSLQVGPGIEFITNKHKYVDSEGDITLNMGISYDITDSFGVEARFKKGLLNAVYLGNGGSLYPFFGDYQTNNTFQVGLYYKLNKTK